MKRSISRLRFTAARVKRKINWKYRAFSARYITDTTCRTTRIVSILSLTADVCTCGGRAARARKTMRLGLQCLANRLSESYRFQRIASASIQRESQKGEMDGKNVRAPRDNKNMEDSLRTPRKECMQRPFFRFDRYVYRLRSELLLYTHLLCFVWTVKISPMSNATMRFIQSDITSANI